MKKTHVIDHPLVQHKIGLMRDKSITTKDFRALTSELAAMLTYEATAHFSLNTVHIESWCGPVEVNRLAGKKVTVVPILRAGLGMLDGVLEHLPSAKVSVVGMYRDETTAEPVPYYAKFCDALPQRTAIVIDPLLATGGSMVATIDLLKQNGCQNIKVLTLIAAPEGIEKLTHHHPDIQHFTAAIDDHLDEHFYIIPGLGDAGDKVFGTK